VSDNEFFSVEFDIPLSEMGDGYILAVLRHSTENSCSRNQLHERRVRNIRDRFENSNANFPREGEGKGRRKKIKNGCSGDITPVPHSKM